CRSFGGGFQDWHCRRTCSTFPAHTARFHWRVVHMRSSQAHTACGTRANTNTSTKTSARPRTHRERALHSGESRISAKADKSNNNQFEKRRMRIFLHCEIMNAFQLDASGERCESARKCINNERPTGRQS